MEKRITQDILFPLINKKRLVGLAGPNIEQYLAKVPSSVKTIEIWENDPLVLGKQVDYMVSNPNKGISINFGNVKLAEVDTEDSFYDLDFCCTVRYATEHINRFRSCAFMLTLSNRGISLSETIETFLRFADEELEIDIPARRYNLLKTNKNTYIYTTYYDTSSMLTIFKIH